MIRHRNGYAQSMVHALVALGVPGVVRAKGTATLFVPGWTGKVYGPTLPRHWSVGMVLDQVETEYGRDLGAPFVMRCIDPDPERALVTVRAEDFAAAVAAITLREGAR